MELALQIVESATTRQDRELERKKDRKIDR